MSTLLLAGVYSINVALRGILLPLRCLLCEGRSRQPVHGGWAPLAGPRAPLSFPALTACGGSPKPGGGGLQTCKATKMKDRNRNVAHRAGRPHPFSPLMGKGATAGRAEMRETTSAGQDHAVTWGRDLATPGCTTEERRGQPCTEPPSSAPKYRPLGAREPSP